MIKGLLSQLLLDDEGAIAVDYAVIAAALVLAVYLVIYGLANWEGDGLVQEAHTSVANKIGTFGSIE